MIEVSIHPLDRTNKEIEVEWRQLESLANPSFFTSWDWVGTLIASAPDRCSLSLLRLFEEGKTAGLAYLGRERSRRHLLVSSRRLHLNSPAQPEFNCLTTEDNQLLTSPALERRCWEAVLRWFAHKQDWVDELLLPGLKTPLDQTELTRDDYFCINAPLLSYHVNLNRLGTSRGQFGDLLSRNARYQLRRSIRDYGGVSSLRMAEARSAEEALAWFNNMKHLHVASWTRRGKPHSFARPFFEIFHRNLIQRTFSAGRIQMLRVDASMAPIGYLYNFRDGQRTYAYQSGFADGDRRFRPGAVCHALAIEHNFQLGVQVYDFMAGSNRLKNSFATDRRWLYWTTVQRPRLLFRLEHLARIAKQRFRRPIT